MEAIPNVASVTYVSRGEAMDNFQAEHPDNLLLSGLHDEVLRARFRIHVTDIEQMAATSTQVEGTEGFTATREKEPIISRQHTIIHTAAKDIKPWVKMLLKPSAMK
mgnify:CR=1 FL=1